MTATEQVPTTPAISQAAVLFGSAPGPTMASRFRLSALRALRTLMQGVAATLAAAGVGSELLSVTYVEVLAYSLLAALMTAVASFLQNAAAFLPDDPSQRPVQT